MIVILGFLCFVPHKQTEPGIEILFFACSGSGSLSLLAGRGVLLTKPSRAFNEKFDMSRFILELPGGQNKTFVVRNINQPEREKRQLSKLTSHFWIDMRDRECLVYRPGQVVTESSKNCLSRSGCWQNSRLLLATTAGMS